MWILNKKQIINLDNVVSLSVNEVGDLVLQACGNTTITISGVPEDIIHQIWLANKKTQDIIVIQ